MELPPSWFVKASAIWGECLNYRGEGRGAELGGGGKNRETVTASHCLVFEGRAETLSPRLIESTKKYTPQR